MKRLLVIAGLCVLVAMGIAAGIVYSWTFVPHGRLDPEVAIFYRLSPSFPTDRSIPIERQRERIKRLMTSMPGKPETVERIENRSIPGPAGKLPIRIYWPSSKPSLPILVYFHGGAFRVCDLDTHDRICRGLAAKAAVLVVSVGYRLAPEDPFPAAVEDCYAAVKWVFEHASGLGGDPMRIAVGGDSAGGNLAAVTAINARNLGRPNLAFQLLVYPVTDMSSYETESWQNLGSDYLLTREAADFMRRDYIPDLSERSNPLASPLLVENLQDLPPALVITAEFDPLRDEGEAYVRKLQSAGVPARYMRFEGVLHGFFGIPIFRKGRQALDEAAAILQEALREPSGSNNLESQAPILKPTRSLRIQF
jgi:acetyl esterase